MRCSRFLSVSIFLVGGLLLAGGPAAAQVQQSGAPAPLAGSKAAVATTPAPATLPPRLQPLFGGISAVQATQLLGATRLDNVARSFSSRAEASAFFARKGYEYFNENQPDTATYRFNLAWLLNPRNADAYHGLALIASTRAGSAAAALPLLSQALVLAPTDANILADLGATYLNRYAQTKKKKDLTAAAGHLERALTLNPSNAAAWQSTARVRYHQEQYPAAWEAVRKGQALDMTSLDFNFLTELMARQPDPLGVFK